MTPFRARLFGAIAALTLAAGGPALAQQLELKLMAPAAPGGGGDQTARAMQQALVASGVARSVQVTNVAGAGGSVGIAQFVNGAKGDGNQLMVNGFVMGGAHADCAPHRGDSSHRRSGEFAAQDGAGSGRSPQGRYRQSHLCRRLGRWR